MENPEEDNEIIEPNETSISDESATDESLTEDSVDADESVEEEEIPIPEQPKPKPEMNFDEIMKLAEDITFNGRVVMREHAIAKSMKQKAIQPKQYIPEPKQPKVKVPPTPKAEPFKQSKEAEEDFAEFLLDKVQDCLSLFKNGDPKQAETVVDYLDKLIEIRNITSKQKKEIMKQFK
jgi:hypothetical protein